FRLLVFPALTEGARRATGVSAGKNAAIRPLFAIFFIPSGLLLPHRFSLHLKPVRCMHQPVQDTVGHRGGPLSAHATSPQVTGWSAASLCSGIAHRRSPERPAAPHRLTAPSPSR